MGFDDEKYNVGMNSTVYKNLKKKKTVRIKGVDYNVELLESDIVNEEDKNLINSVDVSNIKKEEIKIEK